MCGSGYTFLLTGCIVWCTGTHTLALWRQCISLTILPVLSPSTQQNPLWNAFEIGCLVLRQAQLMNSRRHNGNSNWTNVSISIVSTLWGEIIRIMDNRDGTSRIILPQLCECELNAKYLNTNYRVLLVRHCIIIKILMMMHISKKKQKTKHVCIMQLGERWRKVKQTRAIIDTVILFHLPLWCCIYSLWEQEQIESSNGRRARKQNKRKIKTQKTYTVYIVHTR